MVKIYAKMRNSLQILKVQYSFSRNKSLLEKQQQRKSRQRDHYHIYFTTRDIILVKFIQHTELEWRDRIAYIQSCESSVSKWAQATNFWQLGFPFMAWGDTANLEWSNPLLCFLILASLTRYFIFFIGHILVYVWWAEWPTSSAL